MGLFDSLTGGNLLLALPFSAARPIVGGGQAYVADVGDLNIAFAALADIPLPAAYTGNIAAVAQGGSFFDAAAIIGPGAIPTQSGYAPQAVNEMPATPGSLSPSIAASLPLPERIFYGDHRRSDQADLDRNLRSAGMRRPLSPVDALFWHSLPTYQEAGFTLAAAELPVKRGAADIVWVAGVGASGIVRK